MAAVPEIAWTAESAIDTSASVEPTTEKPGPTNVPTVKNAKAQRSRTEAPAPAAGSLRAIGNAWIESLRKAGHSVSTVSSYSNDLDLAYEHLCGDGPVRDLTERQIAGFNSCNLVTKKRSGKAKAKPTILKTRRALRLALVWAEQKGLLKRAPYPSKTTA